MTIKDLLAKYSIPTRSLGEHHHATSKYLQVDCPFCSKLSGRFRLGIALHWQGAVCWTCGHLGLANVLMELTGEPYRIINRLLADLDTPTRTAQDRPRGHLTLPKGLAPLLPAHKRYMRSRGLEPDELAGLWGLQGIGPAAKLAWRIWIPVHYHGQVVSWTTRAIADGGQRYISARPEQETMPTSQLLYGNDLVRGSGVIVVEGPVDAWRIGPGAVAMLGLRTSQAQLNRLSKYSLRVVCLDSEPVAQTRARQLCNSLAPFGGRTVNVELDAKDAGEASDKEIAVLRRMIE